MFDPTPAPYGEVTRRWTQLTDLQRATHVGRLAGDCPGDAVAHVDDPPLDDGRCYARLVRPALAGDEIAWGWLATTHRPLLLVRGRALFAHDPCEWGATGLEALHTTFHQVDPEGGRWLRRRVAQQLIRRLARATDQQLSSARHERLLPPASLRRMATATPSWDPHPELSLTLERLLGELDTATRDAFAALAQHRPLYEVANRHDLSYDALRQRVARARRRLQPELAGFLREPA